jgi:hypothetical protein
VSSPIPVPLQVPAFIRTIAGNGTGTPGKWGDSGDGGPATAAELYNPIDIAVDGFGNVYIAELQRIRKVSGSTGIITTIVGNGTYGFSGDGGPASNAQLNENPYVAVDSAGNLYIADTGNYRIRTVNSATGIITTIAGVGSQGFSGDGGPATAAQLSAGPITLDQAGNIYFSDSGRIRRIDVSTGIITTVAGTSAANGYSGQGDGGPATSAFLYEVIGLGVDGLGNLYFSAEFSARIRKIDAKSGIITTIAGNGVVGYAGDYLPATNAQIAQNATVGVDLTGNVYIADGYNNRVRKVDEASGIITTIAGTGISGYLGDNQMANVSQLFNPDAVAIDSAGNLYISDYGNQRVRKVNASNFP